MGNSFETNFIRQAVDQTPFAGTPAQNFFAEWCKINDSIVPQFIDRDKWEKRDKLGILEKNEDGKQSLFLPHDLHLWEMINVIRAVDHDTLTRTYDKKNERADQIQELGVIFEKAGLYLSKYSPEIKYNEGGKIAEDIAHDFYQYGLSIQHKVKKEDQIPHLSQEDKTKLDEWFLGKEAYQKRLTRLIRLGENSTEEEREEVRRKLLKVYFGALAREGYNADGEKPWETKVGPMQHLQNSARRRIEIAIETPEREMKTTIFRRGVEKLVTEMTEMKEVGWRKLVNDLLKKIGLDPILEQRRLYDTLHIDNLKQELETVKETGDATQISAKELEIAKKIQKAVSSFPYKATVGSYRPSEMVKTQFISCVGSSILGGALLDEVGIKYLHADLPEHSATVLITSDGKVYWQDFTPGAGDSRDNYTEINSDMVDEEMDLSDVPEGGTTLHFKKWNPYPHIKGKLRVNLFRPEIGLQCHILNNTGHVLSALGRTEEAIKAYQQAISVNPKFAISYYGLGIVLSALGKNKEAIEAYQQAISVDPKYANPYNGLGNALSALGKNKEAIEAYKQAIRVDPKFAYPYNGLGNALSALDRNKEAIEAYQQAIRVDPKYANPYNGLGNALSALSKNKEAIEAYKTFIKLLSGDAYWVDRAQVIIEELQSKISSSEKLPTE